MADWHLKTAMVLAGQLPDNPDDARVVLQAVQDLLDNFLAKPTSADATTDTLPDKLFANVVAFKVAQPEA
jgi:hypothetical protein